MKSNGQLSAATEGNDLKMHIIDRVLRPWRGKEEVTIEERKPERNLEASVIAVSTKKQNFRGVAPKGFRRTDERLLEIINEFLAEHPDIDAHDIEVRVDQEAVYLMGSVPDRRTKHLVEDSIEEILGVKGVTSQLTVRRMEESEQGTGAIMTATYSSH